MINEIQKEEGYKTKDSIWRNVYLDEARGDGIGVILMQNLMSVSLVFFTFFFSCFLYA